MDSGVTLPETALTHAREIDISINMDRRSLELNYENNLLVADHAVVQAIRTRQLGYMSVSQPVDLDTVRAWPYRQRLLQNAIGMMAPLL